jgi:hypothetical protein
MPWHNAEAKGCGSGKRNKFTAVHAGVFGGGLVGRVGLLTGSIGRQLSFFFHTAVVVKMKRDQYSEFFKALRVAVNMQQR